MTHYTPRPYRLVARAALCARIHGLADDILAFDPASFDAPAAAERMHYRAYDLACHAHNAANERPCGEPPHFMATVAAQGAALAEHALAFVRDYHNRTAAGIEP
jgi:hypothetical protein